jgi:methylthioribose-1-phosphate isomerase
MKYSVPTLRWFEWCDPEEPNGTLELLDQCRLPGEVERFECRGPKNVWAAIKELRVRGAPAIGVAAAYGVCLARKWAIGLPTADAVKSVTDTCDLLATSRPTAVNLFWALDRMRRVATAGNLKSPAELFDQLLAEARAIHAEDVELCGAIARHGADLLASLPAGSGILTHCNAGALATAGDGTALGVIFELARRGKKPHVWVDETRPLLQGARLTAWELSQRGVDCTLICDSMAAQVMREGRVAAVIVGADRVAADGAAANKIGTYSVAVVAAAHSIPLYVAAPASSFDLSLGEGQQIPIEQRDAAEVTHFGGAAVAPAGVAVYNPAFDVTPPELIRAIITDRGVIEPVCRDSVARVLGEAR